MNLHLDLTLTEEQTQALQMAAAQRGLPVEALVQRAVERFLIHEHARFADMLTFARGIDFSTADAQTVLKTLEQHNFIYPQPTELMAMSEEDRSVLLQLSALLMEEEYRNNPVLTAFEAYEILDYDDNFIATDAPDHS